MSEIRPVSTLFGDPMRRTLASKKISCPSSLTKEPLLVPTAGQQVSGLILTT